MLITSACHNRDVGKLLSKQTSGKDKKNLVSLRLRISLSGIFTLLALFNVMLVPQQLTSTPPSSSFQPQPGLFYLGIANTLLAVVMAILAFKSKRLGYIMLGLFVVLFLTAYTWVAGFDAHFSIGG